MALSVSGDTTISRAAGPLDPADVSVSVSVSPSIFFPVDDDGPSPPSRSDSIVAAISDLTVEFALSQEFPRSIRGIGNDEDPLALALPLALCLEENSGSQPSSSSHAYPYPRYAHPQNVRILYCELDPNPSKGNKTFFRFWTSVNPVLLLFQHWAVEVSPHRT